MAVVMKVSGLTGESKLGEQEGWLPIEGFEWGATRNYTFTHGMAQVLSAAQLKEAVVRRQADSTSAQLWMQVTKQETLKVQVRWLRPKATEATHFLEVTLTNARVSSIEDASGGDRPIETVKFSYEEIEFIYFALDDSINAAQQVVTYELPKG
ncbi:type VI secretion system tube protein Hcp [Roseomonas sp. JC162]|uniref:Type VI secretion system tube protein Hcp n=1 Tax=Neoroseomonas marina TaxID=1232220 RepID=A0A848E8Q8_9PROT|nr:type VI secretion system tube protein Hcp [Neoroseomonas marina]NMJ39949.1 type VI secretion system tube protein Hcp [Neoroseomonas marina]